MFQEQVIHNLRLEAEQMEQAGQLSRQALDLIYKERLFKLFIPDALGGRMTPLPEALKWFEEAARIDGSFGWLVQIGSGAGFFVTTIEPTLLEMLFSREDVYIAGSDRANGIAKQVDGGFLVSGSWPFCSGSMHATLFTANCRLVTNDKRHDSVLSFIFLPDQVQIEKDWQAFGLKATNSHTIHVENVFVPNERVFDVFSPHTVYDHPVYHYPFLPFATANICATAIGIGRHFFEESKSVLKQKARHWSSTQTTAMEQYIQQLEQPFLTGIRRFYAEVDLSWQTHLHNGSCTEEQLQAIVQTAQSVTHVCVYGAQQLFRQLGMVALLANQPINRIFRDLLTVSQHTLLNPKPPFSHDRSIVQTIQNSSID